jgi:diguanylate cyclase (GGDEF)-like protein/PAS domain S-box-containing protein
MPQMRSFVLRFRRCAGIAGWLLVLLAPAHATERSYYFQSPGAEQGLLQHTVTAIFQDRNGYLWIGTQAGLHKYDGYRFTPFQHDASDPGSLPDSFVSAIAETGDGQLWIGSNSGDLSRLDPNSGKTVPARPTDAAPARKGAIQSLRADGHGGIWLGGEQSISWIDSADRSTRDAYRARGSKDLRARRLALGVDDSLWAATSEGLLNVDRSKWSARVVAASELSAPWSVLVAHDGTIYAGSDAGLFRIDVDGNHARRVWPDNATLAAKPNAIVSVWDIAEDSRGRMWLAIHGEGLLVFDPINSDSQWLRPDRELIGSLPEAFVTSLFVDRSGLLWIGGEARGLVSTDPRGAAFRYIVDHSTGHDLVNANNVRAIYEDADRKIWLGTDGDGLKRYDPDSGKFSYYGDLLNLPPGISAAPELRVQAVIGEEAGRLVVGTNRGAYLLDPERRKANVLPLTGANGEVLPDANVRALLRARDGSLWFGTTETGVAHYWPSGKRWEYLRHENGNPGSLTHDQVLSLYQDRADAIWIGTRDGLNVYYPATGKLRTFRQDPADPGSLSGNLVRAVHESADGILWVGTHSGLNRLDALDAGSAHFTRFGVREGLPEATIYAILDDGRGRLWLSTNRGIALMDRDTDPPRFRAFSAKDGLQGLEFNGGSALRTTSGDFLFGGPQGLNAVRPNNVENSTFHPPIAITALQVGRQPIQLPATLHSKGLALEQAERVVRLEFAALDFAAPERNQFAYRLEGFDDNWIPTNARHDATYTNLAAGHYLFRVKATNRDGVWNPDTLDLPITLTPVWWVNRYALIAYFAVVAVVLLLLWRARQRRRVEDRQHTQELKHREDRLRLALWGSGDEFWDVDIRNGILFRIGSDQLLGGQPEQSISIDDWRQHAVHPEDLPQVDVRMQDHIAGRRDCFESEHRIRNASSKWIWVLSRGKIVERDSDGKPLRMCGTARDISHSRQIESDRRIAAEVIRSMSEAVSVSDLEFKFRSVNQAFERITGYSAAEVIGKSAALLNCSQHPAEHYLGMRDSLMRSGHWRGELWQRRKDGEEFLSWIEISEVCDANGIRTHFVAVLADITDRKRAEQELRYLANYDTLTGLPNRTLLGERLGHAVIRARRSNRKVAVLFLDLDRFKHVNDSMGHAAGDRMLKAAGARLRASVRDADTVARLGGDEFTVVLEDIVSVHEAERIARKLLEVFTQPLELENGQEVVISPSIGISLYPDHGQVPTDLLKFADTAMYQAKDRGRNTYAVYTEAMDASARLRANMMSALRKAMERREFSLVYQPKLSLEDNRITGVEALLRWHSEELGSIAPTIFIPLAEESGLIVEIGEFVLNQACAELYRWREHGIGHLAMAVNVSVMQLLRGELSRRLSEILADHDISASQIELELTESMLMANAEHSVKTLNELKSIGVTLTIDDFGTGYSSLSYLKRLPIDSLKIDKEFVGDITTDPDDEAITSTIITMAHSLGLNVVAEGVETAEQLEYLREQRCDEIQGYWLAMPMAGEQCRDFILHYAGGKQRAVSER